MTNLSQHPGWGLRIPTSAALVLAVLLTMGVAVQSVKAQTSYKLLHKFTGAAHGKDGASPFGNLLRDGAGNLYGTTINGGLAAINLGIVFKLDADGKYSVLHRFTALDVGGGSPYGALVRDGAGNLYGTTIGGGTFFGGTVFKLNTLNQLTVLHSFSGSPDDGCCPYAGLIRDATGNLYGSSVGGGPAEVGTVFAVSSQGDETILYSFGATVPQDGVRPVASLIQDADGNLYGTTQLGGVFGVGTVFKLDPTGMETVLYSFSNVADGGEPTSSLLRDIRGNLYGTTQYGGTFDGGTVFKVDTAGKETILYSFGAGTDGLQPAAGLVRDGAGNLYGTTYYGGALGVGTVFKLDKTGRETILHSFTGGADSAHPQSSLVRDSAGNLYGTTFGDFVSDRGSVFELTFP